MLVLLEAVVGKTTPMLQSLLSAVLDGVDRVASMLAAVMQPVVWVVGHRKKKMRTDDKRCTARIMRVGA